MEQYNKMQIDDIRFLRLLRLATHLERNAPCWCGSGIKFKNCHLKREHQQPVTEQEIIENSRRTWGKKYCLHPHAQQNLCKGKIVKAHTIQRNGGLSAIARDGYVYSALEFIKKNPAADFNMELVGIKNASTFTGFCTHHDATTFAPIEQRPLAATQEHTFLLGFRAISQEIFKKRAQLEDIPFMRTLDKGKSLGEQIQLKIFLDDWQLGVSSGLRDLEVHKSEWDGTLLVSDFQKVHYYVLWFDQAPNFVCTGLISPECDFYGKTIQDLSKTGSFLDCITFSLLPTDNGGAAIFSWLNDNKACNQLIESLHHYSDNDIPHAVCRFAFEFFENLFVSPDWWEQLKDDQKTVLLQRQASGQLEVDRNSDCLVDDGYRLVNWNLLARETNLRI